MKRDLGFGFCERCGKPFSTEGDIYSVRDKISDEVINVCKRCYKEIMESEDGYTKYGGVEEVIEEELARLREIVSKNVEQRFFELLERYETPLSRFVHWFTDKHGRLIIEVKGEEGLRGVRIVINKDYPYDYYGRVKALDWCSNCSAIKKELKRMDAMYKGALREVCKVLTEEQKEKLRKTKYGRALAWFF
ncbi:MAG: hypothetical protein ACTSXC_02115 [Candidatus Freyarchaeota archaeon]